MKKQNLLGLPLVSILIGIILVFYSFYFLDGGKGAVIAIGAFAILIGAAYLVFGILTLCLGEKVKAIPQIATYVNTMGVPVFYFVFYCVSLANGLGDLLGSTGWISIIGIFVSTVSVIVFTILYAVLNNNVMSKLNMIFMLLFSAFFVITVVFSVDGAPATIGTVTLPDLMLLVSYVSVAFLAQKHE